MRTTVVSDLYSFFCPTVAPGTLDLPEDQAHHALHVLRLADGSHVRVFDGRGTWAKAILRTTKRAARVEIGSDVHLVPSPRRTLTLATAAPKGDRAEWLIEQASQLNVTRVIWLACDRSVVKPREENAKWQRLAIESAKQCGRAWVMQVGAATKLEAVLEEATRDGATVLWLEPHAGAAIGDVAGEEKIVALIGPEGGWSERETELLKKHARVKRVRLTPTILRIETACAAIASVVGCY